MEIRVISLATSSSRRSNIARQFAVQGIAYEFFDAITPARAPSLVAGYDESEFVLNCGRGATDREIACYASHLQLWRQCAASGQPLLILEDDAQLSRSFRPGLRVIAQHITRYGVIRAALPLPKYSNHIVSQGAFALRYCRRVPLQALGYALSPVAAAQLARAGATIEEPLDKFLQRFWRHGLRIYALFPAIVEHSRLARVSDIGDRSRARYDVSTRLRRVVRKSANSLSRAYSNLAFLQDH